MLAKLLILTLGWGLAVTVFAEPKMPGKQTQQPVKVQDLSRAGALFDELAKLDAELFDAAFISCDPKKFAQLFTDDAEFYHDLAGAKFGPEVRTLGPCPKDKGLSRLLNRGSVQVFAVEGYGAIQTGEHSFVQHGSKTIEVAHFVHLWRKTANGWKMARILSFGHQQVAQ